MSQRKSGYARKLLEFYPTPAWVTESLLAHVETRPGSIWEPAAGQGQMVVVLAGRFLVLASDIAAPRNPRDFLSFKVLPDPSIRGIITNPPYGPGGRTAHAFARHALDLTQPFGGFVAMLLKVDFDSGATRRDLFADCPAWARKIVLTKRITWFVDPATGKPKASPSENHAWYLWDWRHAGPAQLAYAP